MLSDIANKLVDALDHLAKKFVVADTLQAPVVARGLTVAIVDVNEVNVAGYVQFAST